MVPQGGESAALEPAPVRSVEPHLRGVSLSKYAGVLAGLGAGLELDVVLANEGVEPSLWSQADETWSACLADDADVDGPLHAAFDERLAAAQERYGRPLPPLDRDLAAWLDFTRLWSADPEPLVLLKRLRLHPVDVVRLQRLWTGKIERDATLAAEAKALLEREPRGMPAIEPGPVPVVPPPPEGAAVRWEDEEGPESDELLDAEDDDDEDEDDDAAEGPGLFVPMEHWRVDEESPPPIIAPKGGASVPRGGEEIRPAPVKRPAPLAAAAPPPAVKLDQTMPVQIVMPVPPLPFQAAAREWIGTQRESTPKAPLDVGATLDITGMVDLEHAQRDALPFARSSPAAALPPPVPVERSSALKVPSFGGETLELDALVGAERAVLPFEGPAKAPAILPAADPRGPDKRAPALLEETLDIGALLASSPTIRDVLPFDPSATPVVPTPRAEGAPSATSALGKTLDISTLLHEAAKTAVKVTPFQRPSPSAPASSPAESPSEPQAPSPLTLEQYASLCVELEAAPAQAPEITSKYGLTWGQWEKVNSYWRGRMARESAVRAAWERGCVTYREWLLRR